jgi:murein L,D-transpeptidase YafK
MLMSAQAQGSPEEILRAVDASVSADHKDWCEAAGLRWPPEAVVLRIFKKEREAELWGMNAGQKRMSLIKTLPVCAMDFEPGPKLREGDKKTPEGFYRPAFEYGSKFWFMWLDPARPDDAGEVGKGYSFKLCTEYPNKADTARSKAAGMKEPGSEICIHGNCVSVGCASFKNRDFLHVYSFSRHHDAAAHGPPQVHIFPFRFDRVSAAERSSPPDSFVHLSVFPKQSLLRFWENLEQGFALFNKDPNPLSFKATRKGYSFR